MMCRGLVDETRLLLSRGYTPAMQSMRSLGYCEICRYLQGEIPLNEAVELIKRNTRRYAKRQCTWFRHYPGWGWISLDRWSEEEAAEAVVRLWKNRSATE
jgi:tRNA dimethylallyltransferase